MRNAFIFTSLISASALFAAPIAIEVKPQSAEVERYAPLFASISMAVNYANPYDPDDVKVDLVATTPGGRTVTQPCFFLSGTPAGSKWEARWTPRDVGTHTYVIRVTSTGETSTSDSQTLKVNPSDRNGFLHMDTAGAYFQFRFDSGRPWRGVGLNFGWQDAKFSYESMFALLKKNGANTVRTWQGPGTYYMEQAAGRAGWIHADSAARLDQVLKLAEQNGLYLMPTFDPIKEYLTGLDGWSGQYKWLMNPYSTAKGGPCAGPQDFFTNTRARKLYKQRVRYTLARWGYSPYMAFYEFFNEVDWANLRENAPIANIADWHKDMSAYLKSIDPYGKPVTSSLSHSDFTELWSLKDMDFTQRHLYGSMDQHATRLEQYSAKYGKPYVTGEFSLDYRGTTQHTPEAYGNELHKGLWRGLFTPTPILPMTWWWQFHAEQNHFFHFLHCRAFSEKSLDGARSLVLTTSSGPQDIEVRAFKSERGLFAWVNNRGTSARANVQVKVRGGRDANFEWGSFNTLTGSSGALANVKSAGDELAVTIPSLAAGGDMALSFMEKVPVVLADFATLPRGWSILFDPSTGRLKVENQSADASRLGYALQDMRGRNLFSGEVGIGAHGQASLVLEPAGHGPGVHALVLTVGPHRVVRMVAFLR